MSNTVIKVENLSKQYRLGQVGTGTLTHDLKRWWAQARGKEDPFLLIGEENNRETIGVSDYVWALRDINFEVKQGEVLGIIGKNGAGKSTLLKILSKITSPTVGSVKIKGRIASLLEVGTGFHPELSGRDNIYLNGAILGMTKNEIKSKFDEIVDFSGVERYIDTPVKRYSSGMYVRLAFAVAAHLEPEILIVDEVLAVGDAEFQKKCLGKMKDVAGQGRTVLFVSHNISSIRQLCQKGLLLNNGTVELAGSAEDVIRHYFNSGNDTLGKPSLNQYRTGSIDNVPVYVSDIFISSSDNFFPTLSMGIEPEIKIRINVREDILRASITISFFNAEGLNLGIAFSWDDNFYLDAAVGVHEITFKLKDKKFPPGKYFIGVGLNQSDNTVAWDGIGYYPIFIIENQVNIEKFSHRRWGVNHYIENLWAIEKVS